MRSEQCRNDERGPVSFSVLLTVVPEEECAR